MRRSIFVAFIAAAAAVMHDVAIACEPMGEPKPWQSAGLAQFVAVAANADPLSNEVRGNLLAGRNGRIAIAPGPIVLVAWSFGPDCKPVAWNLARDGAWSPAPGAPAFYTGKLRARDQWIGGVQTIDLEMARLQPVWHGGEKDRQKYGAAPGTLLTAMEFYEFYAILPTEEELEHRRSEALSRVDAWERAHREMAAREPVQSMLRHLRMIWPR